LGNSLLIINYSKNRGQDLSILDCGFWNKLKKNVETILDFGREIKIKDADEPHVK